MTTEELRAEVVRLMAVKAQADLEATRSLAASVDNQSKIMAAGTTRLMARSRGDKAAEAEANAEIARREAAKPALEAEAKRLADIAEKARAEFSAKRDELNNRDG